MKQAFALGLSIGIIYSANPALAGDGGSPAGQPPLIEHITQIEEHVLKEKAPSSESCQQKMEKIETKLFGKPQLGSLLYRLSKIENSITSSPQSPGQGNAIPFTVLGAPQPAALPGSQPESVDPKSDEPKEEGALRAIENETNGAKPKLVSMMPKLAIPKKTAPLKVGISQSFVKGDAGENQSTRQLSEQAAYEWANQAIARRDLERARQVFETLCEQHPKDARYFYGAALACQLQNKNVEAFPFMVLASHLGGAKYEQSAQALTEELKKQLGDDCFRLRFDWKAEEPQAVLNAGVRLWKAGLNAQAIKLFEYSLKNEPDYGSVALYNLGAMSERSGDFKLALQFYKLSADERARLASLKTKNPLYGQILDRNIGLVTDDYLRRATGEVQQKLLRINVKWNGLPQGYGTHWSTEVCPMCGISRTFTKYDGQNQL